MQKKIVSLPLPLQALSRKMLKRGWLKILIDVHWQKRWIELHSSEELLGWFDDVAFELDQPIGPPQLILNLDTISAIVTAEDPNKEYKFVFKLISPNKSPILFACESKNDYNEWSELIQDLCPSSHRLSSGRKK